MALQLRPRHRTLHNPSIVQFFSSSTTPDPTALAPLPQSDTTDANSPPSQSRGSSFFSDVKAKLRQDDQRQQMRQQFTRNPTSPPSFSNSPQQQRHHKICSIEEIKKGLSEFRQRPSPSVPGEQSQPRMSFEDVLKRSVLPKGGESNPSRASMSFSDIRDSLKNLKSPATPDKRVSKDPLSIAYFKDSLNLKPDPGELATAQKAFAGKTDLPGSMFGKEKEEVKVKKAAMKTGLSIWYSHQELGEKLRNLRPPQIEKKGKDGGGFSFLELNERLARLREMEEKETASRITPLHKSLRDSLLTLHNSVDDKSKKNVARKLDILGQLSLTPDFMLEPPKEHLVEKYFHTDNMSASDKLKIELAKVRDEFKISESDCGSARVQVAQLTTKIKHLSASLHKKDKHSRKGLEGMVQKRKNLLKYLRRTDWDSYCLVLSKLGLRDNPNYKL